MKKIILPALAVIAFAVTFNSCTMEKRHYLKGYYIDGDNHKEISSNSSVSPAKEIPVSGIVTGEKSFRQPVKAEATPVASSAQPVSGKSMIAPKPKKTLAAVTRLEPVKELSSKPGSQNDKMISQGLFREKKNSHSGGGDVNTVLLVILAILLPPLAVYLYEGSWTKRCTINVILTLLCGLPGMIHALIVVLS